MCSINGAIDFQSPHAVGEGMALAACASMSHRGPDDTGHFHVPCVTLCHNRLAVMDPARGKQPMSAEFCGRRYTIVYNGEIYNAPELSRMLCRKGAVLRTKCDTEVVLWSYILLGERCAELLNGIFAFAVFDEGEQKVFLARDRFGVKPLYYATVGTTLYFASEVKALLAAGIAPEVDVTGLWQLLYLTPVTLPGSSVFRHIKELLPAHTMTVSREGVRTEAYWRLEARPCADSRDTAVARVRELFFDAVTRQLQSDVPLAVLLSGGLDSSAVTAVAAAQAKKNGTVLDSYSFEYEGNRENFKSSLFQPQSDEYFAAALAERLGCAHTVLTAPTEAVAAYLSAAVHARDLPGQADIDSSLLYFCERIKKRHTVVLSGECSDEIFGGYPWFYRPEMLSRDFFPWIHDPAGRIRLFDDSIVRAADGLCYLREVCQKSTQDCPTLPDDSESMRHSRVATWLSTRYFMANLLERKDRMSMAAALEVRVPFADHRILEYVFNLPWEYKYENGVEKSLLRHAMEGELPAEVLWRKKSPYPKTHDPRYEAIVRQMLGKRLEKKQGFLAECLDKKQLAALLEGESTTWFGQLMARPQLLAWLCQLDEWFEHYSVKLV